MCGHTGNISIVPKAQRTLGKNAQQVDKSVEDGEPWEVTFRCGVAIILNELSAVAIACTSSPWERACQQLVMEWGGLMGFHISLRIYAQMTVEEWDFYSPVI